MNSAEPMSDGYWLEVADRRVEELEAAADRYRQALSKIACGPNSAPFSEP